MGEAPAQAQVLSFSAEGYAFTGPEKIEASWQKVRVINREVHQIYFLGLPPDKTIEVEDVNQALAARTQVYQTA